MAYAFGDTTDPNDTNDFSTVTSLVAGRNCGNFSVSGGTYHTCAVVAGNGEPNTLPDDEIECWGQDSPQTSPVPSGSFSQVSAGRFHTCGLRSTGALECWGSNSSGQVSNTPTATDFTQVDSGYIHSCALHSDQSISCWGSNLLGQSTPPSGAFTHVASGNVHSCALAANGTVACWGDNSHNIVSNTPIAADFVQVVAGGEHACGRHQDGTVTCWGRNFSGEALDPSGTFLTITAGDEHNCGLRDDSTVSCWGGNGIGQLDAPADAFNDLDAGAYNTCALLTDGTIQCWGDNSYFLSTPPARSNLCPICGDFLEVGRESCEAPFEACCSPVTCTPYRLTEAHICRSATGPCDGNEFCNGVSLICPADTGLLAGTVCRAAGGGCDPVETCTGSSDQCPPDAPFQPSSFVCRPGDGGGCDVAELCTGLSPTCPADAVASTGTTCRSSAGICDIAESCDGLSHNCAGDAVRASTVTCRAAASTCDVAEKCTGAGVSCPANAFATSGTTCNDNLFCNGAADTCDGSGGCNLHGSPPCSGADGDSDCSETCDESNDNCDTNDPNGSVCDDNSLCTTAEFCTAGVCGGGSTTDCSDTDLCTTDSCDAAEGCLHTAELPVSGCSTSGIGLILVKDSGAPGSDLIKWKWAKGQSFDPALLGRPDQTTDYALCLFDQHSGNVDLVGSYEIPADAAAWKAKPIAVIYSNKAAAVDGIIAAKGKAVETEGKSLFLIKAGGLSLTLPSPASPSGFFDHAPSLVVQLRNSVGGCWTSEFGSIDFKKNESDKVKAIFKH